VDILKCNVESIIEKLLYLWVDVFYRTLAGIHRGEFYLRQEVSYRILGRDQRR